MSAKRRNTKTEHVRNWRIFSNSYSSPIKFKAYFSSSIESAAAVKIVFATSTVDVLSRGQINERNLQRLKLILRVTEPKELRSLELYPT